MKSVILLVFLYLPGLAQTNVYLRSSGPQSQVITGATNATPVVITTQFAHGFSSSCNTTTNICYCAVAGVPTGTGPSPANGVRECVYQSATTLALYDTNGNPIAGTGNWWFGNSPYPGGVLSAQWLASLTKFTIPANPGPLGFLDGTNGDLMRRLSLSNINGLTSTNGIVVSGCSGGANCVVTVNTTYNPTTTKFPIASGQHFSITGTGTPLDTCGDGTKAAGAQSPYTVGSVTASSWTSNLFACSGLTNGDYTNVNLHCGPAATPNDTIGGAQSCSRVSQLATTANPAWNILVSAMNSNNLGSSAAYKTWYDGGYNAAQAGMHPLYAMAAVRFLVDPTNSLWLNEIIYALNDDFRSGGVGYVANSKAWVINNDENYGEYDTGDPAGLALLYAVAAHAPEGSYWTASEQAAFLNRQYNDIDDPSQGACTATNQDAGNQGNHNWILSSGLLAAGTNDSTHAQLPTSDPHYSTTNYYVNTVILLQGNNGDVNEFSHSSFGLITAQSNTGSLTISGGYWEGTGHSGTAPGLNNLVAATYTSGLSSITGTAGQYICLTFGGNSYGLLPLTGTNSIASGTPIQITGAYSFASAPTTASILGGCSTAMASGTVTVSTMLGTQYTIFDTIVTSNAMGSSTNSGPQTATITFTKTSSLSGSIQVGDGIMGASYWAGSFGPAFNMSYVTAVGTNTLSVINGSGPTVSTSTPSIAWRLPQWTSGDCGRLWIAKQQQPKAWGVQPIVYGPGAGTALNNNAGQYSVPDTGANGGGSPPATWQSLELVTALDDSRAVRDLARVNSYLFDYAVRPLMNMSGRLRDGPAYSNDFDRQTPSDYLITLGNTIPGYPSLYGSWVSDLSLWFMFETTPQVYDNTAYKSGWGDASGFGNNNSQLYSSSIVTPGIGIDPIWYFAPTSATAGVFRNWAENYLGVSLWGLPAGATTFLLDDPRIADIDYTGLPLQAAFNQTSPITALTGWPHAFNGDAVFSRTCWQCASGSSVLFDNASPNITGQVYDGPRLGNLTLEKGGAMLLGGDQNPSNSCWGCDSSVVQDTLSLGGPGVGQFLSGLPGSSAPTPITAWAGQGNAGPFGAQFGDSQSRYAAACGNEAPGYNASNLNITLDHAIRCFVHLKEAGDDEFLFQFDDVALASGSPVPMAWHLQYVQNGQTQATSGLDYTTGATTLSAGVITSTEDGNHGRNYGLMTQIFSPATITVNDDCAGLGGSGQCSPGSTYPGGNGYTHRFTIAGGSSVGANVSQFVSVAGHKVMGSLTDTTFTTANLNPDANWTGAQITGAKSTGIALFARGGITHSSITSFTTNFSGTADWLIMGLTPGRYSLTVGGLPVVGSPFSVGPGDSTIYFSSTAGNVVLTQGASSFSTSIQGQTTVTGNAVIR